MHFTRALEAGFCFGITNAGVSFFMKRPLKLSMGIAVSYGVGYGGGSYLIENWSLTKGWDPKTKKLLTITCIFFSMALVYHTISLADKNFDFNAHLKDSASSLALAYFLDNIFPK